MAALTVEDVERTSAAVEAGTCRRYLPLRTDVKDEDGRRHFQHAIGNGVKSEWEPRRSLRVVGRRRRIRVFQGEVANQPISSSS
jgi:hypothetical protein